jgi:isopentenyl phosphate kinase
MFPLIFLKLGGSLITEKDHPRTPRADVLARVAGEIAFARTSDPQLRLVIGHGSGSYGHVAARKHGTRQGVHSPEEWLGFAEVWYEARILNQLVVEALHAAGLPVIAFPPSSYLLAQDGTPGTVHAETFSRALDAGLIPVVNGDVAFDSIRHGTILSTEAVFAALAPHLRPTRILLAGLEAGVWADFPTCTRLMPVLTPADLAAAGEGIAGSVSADVTGGMREKVNLILQLCAQIPSLEALIFSGLPAGNLTSALLGAWPGTRLYAPPLL